MKKLLLLLTAVISIFGTAKAQTWEQVTDASTLQDGDVVVLASFVTSGTNKGKNFIAMTMNSGNDYLTAATFNNNQNDAFKITLKKATNGWYLSYIDGDGNLKYIEHKSSKNNTQVVSTPSQVMTITSNSTTGTVNIVSPDANKGKNYELMCNTTSGSERFTFYAGTQEKITLYKQVGGAESSLLPADLSFDSESITVTSLGTVANAPKLNNPNNLAVTYKSSMPIVASVDPATGEVTVNGFGSATITATSDATDVYQSGAASYNIVVEPVAKSLAEFLQFVETDATLEVKMDFPMTVTYFKANGSQSYIYVTDGTDNILLFAYDSPYTAGDILSTGWVAKYAPYRGLPELKAVGSMPTVTGTTAVKYPEITNIEATDLSRPVLIKGASFAEATPSAASNFKGTASDNSDLNFHNYYELASVGAGKYDVLAVGNVNNGEFRIVPLEYKDTPTAVEAIASDSADVEMFNLNGMKVKATEAAAGIYIIRQGSKISKVVVK